VGVPTANVVVGDGDRVVLVERAAPPDAGTWDTPGGYAEFDEAPRAAAVRELDEETGLRVDAAALDAVHAVSTPAGGRRATVVYFAAPLSATRGTLAPGSDATDAAVRPLDDFDPVRPVAREAAAAARERDG
jgi:ADP-ribose pyrophosphatase YjhB (NUDIX family)